MKHPILHTSADQKSSRSTQIREKKKGERKRKREKCSVPFFPRDVKREWNTVRGEERVDIMPDSHDTSPLKTISLYCNEKINRLKRQQYL